MRNAISFHSGAISSMKVQIAFFRDAMLCLMDVRLMRTAAAGGTKFYLRRSRLPLRDFGVQAENLGDRFPRFDVAQPRELVREMYVGEISDPLRIGARHNYDAIRIATDDVTGIDRHASARNRNIHRAW